MRWWCVADLDVVRERDVLDFDSVGGVCRV